jgi:hypothetical protein
MLGTLDNYIWGCALPLGGPTVSSVDKYDWGIVFLLQYEAACGDRGPSSSGAPSKKWKKRALYRSDDHGFATHPSFRIVRRGLPLLFLTFRLDDFLPYATIIFCVLSSSWNWSSKEIWSNLACPTLLVVFLSNPQMSVSKSKPIQHVNYTTWFYPHDGWLSRGKNVSALWSELGGHWHFPTSYTSHSTGKKFYIVEFFALDKITPINIQFMSNANSRFFMLLLHFYQSRFIALALDV